LRNFLDPSDLAKLDPHLKELVTMDDGKVMAVPQYWNAPMYFYRKDLFDDPKNKSDFKAKYGYELGVPTTWDQLVDIADFFIGRPTSTAGSSTESLGRRSTTITTCCSVTAANCRTSRTTPCSSTAQNL